MKHVVLLNTTKEEPLRILTRRPGVKLTVITEPTHERLHARFVDALTVKDIEDIPAVREAVLTAAKSAPIDYIVTASERTVQAGAYMRTLLGLPGTSYEVANVMTNKFVMKRILAAAGLPVTPFKLLPNIDNVLVAAQGMKWPVVVKPIFGTAGIGIFTIADPEHGREFLGSAEADALRAATIPFILEQAIDYQWEFHCDGIVRDGSVVFAAAARYLGQVLKLHGQPTGACAIPVGSPDHDAIQALHRATVAAVGLRNGVTHMEGYRTADGYLIGEIACRPGGIGVPDFVRLRNGVDLWEAFICSSLEEEFVPGERANDDLLAWCTIPPKTGIVCGLTSQRELEEIPWVRHANVMVDIGDTLSAPWHNFSNVATVIYAAPDPDTALCRMAEVNAFFRLEVAAG
jgi:biotin carboxylase